jgi:Sec-independent protein translocase protein TatA
MSFLGVGPLELFFILVIVIIVIGPRDITKTARTLGRAINKIYNSEFWRTLTETSHALRNLPNRLAEEARLDELDITGDPFKSTREDVAREMMRIEDGLKAWTTPPGSPPIPSKDKTEPTTGEPPGLDEA